jgi:soluble cytochrome b562
MSSLNRIDPAVSVRPTSPAREKPARADIAEAKAARKGADSFSSTFTQVSSALEAGDLAAAKAALDGMDTRGPAYTRATPPGRGPAQTPAHSNSRWNRQIEFQALVDAVRNDQLTGAQEALTALRTPGLQTPAPVPPPVDTPIPVGGETGDVPGEVPGETSPALPEDTVPAEPELGDALTELPPPAPEAPPAGDAALVDILTESTTPPTE